MSAYPRIKNNEKDACNMSYKFTITDKAIKNFDRSDCFTAFNSMTNDSLIIYSLNEADLICYDLDLEEIIIRINNAHKSKILCIKHFLNNHANLDNNKSDIILSSSDDMCVKVWDIDNNWKILLNLENVYDCSYTFISATFAYDKETYKKYIITCNNGEKMKLYDFKGVCIKEIGDNEDSYFIDTFYNIKNKKTYLINANDGNVKVYNDFKRNSNPLIYQDNDIEQDGIHYYVCIRETNEKYQLIESDSLGNVRIWIFNTAKLIRKFNGGEEQILNIMLWNNDYLFLCCEDGTIKIRDLNRNGRVIKVYDDFNNSQLCCIKKIFLSKYGDCFITYDSDGLIKLFT